MKTMTEIMVMEALAEVGQNCDDPYELGLYAIRNVTYYSGVEKVLVAISPRVSEEEKQILLEELSERFNLCCKETEGWAKVLGFQVATVVVA